MQIVIDIPEEVREHIFDLANDGNEIPLGINAHMVKAIVNGTPLPKGHGRIIDESQVTGTFIWDNRYIECYAPTIIEADKEN